MKKLTTDQLALRTEWTTALRSGKYQQTRGKLRDRTGYCCLGVLCDVSGEGKWSKDFMGIADSYIVGNMEDCAYLPPSEVKFATGMDGVSLEHMLPKMNDTYGDDFATIADAIDLDTLMRQDGCL
jgi:hypothetical protein